MTRLTSPTSITLCLGVFLSYKIPRHLASNFTTQDGRIQNNILPGWKETIRQYFDLVLPKGSWRRHLIAVIIPENIFLAALLLKDVTPLFSIECFGTKFSLALKITSLFFLCYALDIGRASLAKDLGPTWGGYIAPLDFQFEKDSPNIPIDPNEFSAWRISQMKRFLDNPTIPKQYHKDPLLKQHKCNITKAPIRDPVYELDEEEKIYYEKEAINAWIEKLGTSPITQRALEKRDLHEDKEMRKRIEDRLEQISKGG